MNEKNEQKKQPTPRQRVNKDCECSGLKIVLLLGRDEAIEGAAAWALRRARALGGDFQLWHTSESDPFGSTVRVMDASGGQQRNWGKYDRDPGRGEKGYDELLAGYPEGCTRIDEFVVIHHGNRVDEDEVIAGLLEILVHEKRIPVCKLVYWACNAAVDLDVSEGHWMDILMKAMGGMNREQDDCPCPGPVELIWPTPGRCYLDPFEGDRLETNDGNVNRMRWGYRHQDGQLYREPDPNNPQPTRNPGRRERARGRGSVLGTVVGRH